MGAGSIRGKSRSKEIIMPKFKTITKRIDTKTWFEFEVWYNTKDLFYIKDGFPLTIMTKQ